MKKLFSVMALLAALILPCLAQAQIRLSLSDQKRFDSYYSRWQSYKATNNQKEVRSMEGRMQDVYRHYGIPANTPYGNVASGGRTWGSGTWNGNRTPDRDWGRDRDRDRDWGRDRDRDRDWGRDRDRDRDWGRDRDRDRDWDRDRDRDDDRDGHHDNGRHRGWYKHHHHHDRDEDQDGDDDR
jgi:hypothetical protein